MAPASELIKTLLLRFCEADSSRSFAFSAGHAGAVAMTDQDYQRFFASPDRPALPGSLAIQFLRLLVGAALPLKTLGILGRALLRRHFSKPAGASKALAVLSLGGTPPSRDAYLGPLLEQLSGGFNCFKIVAGAQVRAEGFSFAESALSRTGLCAGMLFAPVFNLFFAYRLLAAARRIPERNMRALFLLLGMQEINQGTALSQALIVHAMRRHLKNGCVNTILYPLEGRNWEKAIARLANSRGIRSFGYLHCALTPRHLSLISPGFLTKAEWPSTVIAPGAMGAELLATRHPEVSVRKGFFLRGGKSSESGAAREPFLLFALTGNIAESEAILEQIAAFAAKSAIRVVIRLNTNTSTFPYLRQRVAALGLEQYEAGTTALPQLCFFRSSSVAIDYLRNNVVPIYLETDEILSNNIFEIDGKFRLESLRLDSSFGDNMGRLMASYPLGHIFDGKAVANYYLDQDFSAEDLPALLN